MFIDYFRYGPILFTLTVISALPSKTLFYLPVLCNWPFKTSFKNPFSLAPQQTRFLPGAPSVNFNDPNTQIAGLAGLGVTAFAAGNVLSGNDQIRVRPNLGFNFNPQTQALTPALTANVQVGDGPITPSFNVGGQFDPNSQSGIPIAPVVGTAVNIGDEDGLSGSIGTNVALQNGQANPQFGAGGNIGSFNLGSLGGFFGRR